MLWYFLYDTHTDHPVRPNLLLTRQFVFFPLKFPLDKRVSMDSIYGYTKGLNLS